MFTILKITDRDKGLKPFIRNMFKKDEPILTRIEVKDGAPFFTLEVKENKNGLDFPMVAGILGIGAKRIILEDGVTLPENPYLKEFIPEKLPSIMLFNSAKKLIQKCEKPENERICAVIDPGGEFIGYVKDLVPLTSILKIITDCPKKYERVADEILDDWGLPIIITQNSVMLSDCDFIISPFKNQDELYSESIVLKYKDGAKPIRVHGNGITLPPEYMEILPENIDKMKFACALYDLSAVRKLGKLCYDRIIKF